MKIDFHVHSDNSRDGLFSLEEISKAAAERGLDGVCICDHNSYTLSSPVKMNGVWMLPGCEISCKNAHILGIMVDAGIREWLEKKERLPEISEAVARIHEAGGIAVIAHPFAHKCAEGWSPEQMETLPDGVETANGRAGMKYPDGNAKAAAFAAAKGLPTFGGSDAHHRDELGNCYTELEIDESVFSQEKASSELLSGPKAVYVRTSKQKYKGLSQLQRRKRSGKLTELVIGYLYYVKCVAADLFK